MAIPEFLEPPVQGSALAGRVDTLFWFASLIAAVSSALIAGLLLYLGLKYRRRSDAVIGKEQVAAAPPALEVVWTIVPFGVLLFLFAWGAEVFFDLSRPPPTRMNTSWWRGSGCGRFSTPAARARSMSCTPRWAARSSSP